jgi:3-oxoacyl-[acyl-carrier protein] reductase
MTSSFTPQDINNSSSLPLKGKIALITGCTGGIGKATARALALKGASIAVHYHSALETANSLVKELVSYGVDAAAFKANLFITHLSWN